MSLLKFFGENVDKFQNLAYSKETVMPVLILKKHTTLLGEVHLKLAISHSFVLTLRLAERLHVVSGQTRGDSNLNNG